MILVLAEAAKNIKTAAEWENKQKRREKMGFGILLMGYFFAFLMSNLYPAFAFAGSYLIFLAITKLKAYKKLFVKAMIPVGVMMAVALYTTAARICSDFGIDAPILSNVIVKGIFDYVGIAANLAFHLVFFLAIAALAKQTGLEKIRVMSIRNMVLFVAYVTAYVIAVLPIPYPETAVQYIRLALSLMQLLWTLLNMILLIRCFLNMADAEKQNGGLKKEGKEEMTNVEK